MRQFGGGVSLRVRVYDVFSAGKNPITDIQAQPRRRHPTNAGFNPILQPRLNYQPRLNDEGRDDELRNNSSPASVPQGTNQKK